MKLKITYISLFQYNNARLESDYCIKATKYVVMAQWSGSRLRGNVSAARTAAICIKHKV